MMFVWRLKGRQSFQDKHSILHHCCQIHKIRLMNQKCSVLLCIVLYTMIQTMWAVLTVECWYALDFFFLYVQVQHCVFWCQLQAGKNFSEMTLQSVSCAKTFQWVSLFLVTTSLVVWDVKCQRSSVNQSISQRCQRAVLISCLPFDRPLVLLDHVCWWRCNRRCLHALVDWWS